jgi:hypothetical protein
MAERSDAAPARWRRLFLAWPDGIEKGRGPRSWLKSTRDSTRRWMKEGAQVKDSHGEVLQVAHATAKADPKPLDIVVPD